MFRYDCTIANFAIGFLLNNMIEAAGTERTFKFWILQPYTRYVETFRSFGLPGSFLPCNTC